MLVPDARSPEVSDEDKPERRCMQKARKGSVGREGGMKVEKVKEDRKCFG